MDRRLNGLLQYEVMHHYPLESLFMGKKRLFQYQRDLTELVEMIFDPNATPACVQIDGITMEEYFKVHVYTVKNESSCHTRTVGLHNLGRDYALCVVYLV